MTGETTQHRRADELLDPAYPAHARIASRMTNSFIEGLLKVPEHISGFRPRGESPKFAPEIHPPSSLAYSLRLYGGGK